MQRKLLVSLFVVFIALMLTACGQEGNSQKNNASTIEITDMLGRKVTVPKSINKVYSTTPIGTVMVYSFNPEKLAGLNTAVTGDTKYIAESYRNLPVMGGTFGSEGATANMEKILKAAPDVIISVTMADMENTTEISTADRLQTQSGIPVVVVNTNLTQVDKAYEFMGKLLKEEERAKVLADYCRNTILETKAMVDKIPEDKRVRVYYAEGPAGLATDPAGSRHTEVLDLVRGVNVAQVQMNPGSGMSAVSVEKVMLWDPDIIIAYYPKTPETKSFFDFVRKDSKWDNIKAVREGRVYDVPGQPFNWFDRPPSINRIIGIKWLANLLYPDYVPIDIKSETKRFYQLYYHYELTDQEVEDVLKYSVRKSVN
ncbi:MAG: transporter substrate-binding protein [Firmicutes bacterium]|nr:transporter substrate-binding protein [Bacillota bacterium]